MSVHASASPLGTDVRSAPPRADGPGQTATSGDDGRVLLAPYAVRPGRDAVVAAIVVFVVSVLGLGVTYVFTRAAQLQAVRRELQSVALIAASRIDGDAHRRIASPSDEDGPDYRAVAGALVAVIGAATDVRNLYTATLSDGRVRYVVDTDAAVPGPRRETYGAHVGQEYVGVDDDFLRAARTGAAIVNERPTTDVEGTVLSAYAPFYDAHGDYAGVVGADMDVSVYEAHVARLTRITLGAVAAVASLSVLTGVVVLRQRRSSAATHARIHQHFAELAAARASAEQSARAKSTFVAMMSHELRTPLNAIVGYAELMHETLTASAREALARDVQHVETAGRHLTAIISDILDYSKLEAGRLGLEARPLDLRDTLDETVAAFAVEAEAKGLTLRVHVSASAVVADPVRLQQVLRNLVGNAVKFTDRGHVTVRVRAVPGHADRVAIAVHDSGTGIPAAKRALLFQPFSQIDGSLTRRAGGTGLGLVLSLRLVHAMGGTLRVRSREGHGTSVRVTLPAPPPKQAAA